MESKDKPKYQAIGLAGKTSYIFVIPKDFATDIGLEKGDFLRVSKEAKRLIVEKAE
jgi:bifunctional DNA-binding transcriptional regulator/antitoxin component of YhaV-PrlF toxin-antitoxin module